MRAIRDTRPLDLNAETWRRAHPSGEFGEWRKQARACLLEGLHCEPGPPDLRPETLCSYERDQLIVERVAFTTAPWSRIEGYFLRPVAAQGTLPGLVVFHAWGGPMLFGKERIVNSGRDHPVLLEHRSQYYSGRYLAEEFARAGYAVIVVDAHHFGTRAPRGVNGIPQEIDPFELSTSEYWVIDNLVRSQLYLGVRELNWAGTTWMGINFWDDSRCVDYLLSRTEVDDELIGCTGLSGGGWRTNMLAALDERIRASVSGCWMTTGDYQQVYDVDNVIGTFALLPGVWNRMDVPDLITMAAPGASMVISNSEDLLFPPEGQKEAEHQIRSGYEWAGCTSRFAHVNKPKPHCYDAELQTEAIAWFDKHLKRS